MGPAAWPSSAQCGSQEGERRPGGGVVLGSRGRLPWPQLLGLAPSTERAPVTLHLDGIVQVLNCHLSDMAIGMMTRIAVLKWLYHLYIKTPRKVSPRLVGPEVPPSPGCFPGPPWLQGPAPAWSGLGHCSSGETLTSRGVTGA